MGITPPYTLWVPGPLPGENEIIDAAKGHGGRGYGYSTMKRAWTDLVCSIAGRAGIPALSRVRLELTWHEKSRRRNPDNVAAGLKFVLDGLVNANVLKNDGWAEVASWSNTFVVSPGKPGVAVVIHPVASATDDGLPLLPGI